MGVIDKLQFWKKEEEMGPAPEPSSHDLGAAHVDPLQSADPFAQHGQEQPPNFPPSPSYPQGSSFPGRMQLSQPPMQEPMHEVTHETIHPRDIELILAKLDAIKSEMDALHQRVRKIEQATEQKKAW